MVTKGERKIWSRSQSFSSRSKKSGGDDDDETTLSFKKSASTFKQKMRYATPAASASSPSSVSTSQQRTTPDDATINHEESREDVDDDRYSTTAPDDVKSVKLSRTLSSRSNASSFLAGIKDRKKNKKKLDPRPLDDKVRFISPGSDDVRIYSMDSKTSKATAASSKTDGDEDDESEPSFEEDSRYDDDSLGFSRSYDSLWGDQVDTEVLNACNPIPVGMEKTWKSTKKSIQKKIPRIKADLNVELPQNLASLKASACVEMPGMIPSNLKSPTEEDIKRIKAESIKSFNFAKDKAAEWAIFLYKTCKSEEEEEEEEEINDIIEEDKDLILDMKLTAGGGDKIVDEFRRTFSESRFQAHQGVSADAGAPPPILSAKGQVIHQYIVDVASLGKGQSPTQKWSRLSETLLRDPSQAALKDKTGRTPLSYACEYGNDIPAKVMREIIECNPEATRIADNEGKTPLHYYVSANDGAKKYLRKAKVVKLLVKYYYKVTTMRDSFGNTALLSAIEAYAAVNEKAEADLRLPLINAVLDANKDAVAMPNKQQSYPLHFAAKGHHDHLIESLLFHCPSAVKKKNCFGVTPIFLAVYWRAPFDSLKMLLAADPEGATVRSESIGDDPISLVYHSLIYPSSKDDFERVKKQRILMNKANSLKKLPMDIRVEWVMLELLAKAAYHKSAFLDLPEASWRPLHALCALDVPPELVRFACRFHRGDLYDKDEEGRLPIHICASSPTYVKHPSKREAKHSLMRYLLHEDSAVAKIFDKSGRLPIHFACKTGKTWSKGGLKHLVEAHPPSLRIPDGVTGMLPFMLAATHKPSEVPNRHERAERKAANAFPNHDFYAFPDNDKNDIVQAIYDKEEVEQLETVYHLIRSDPGSLIPDLTDTGPKKSRRSIKMEEDQVEMSLEAFSIVRDALSEDQEPEAKPAYGYECYSDDEASNDTNGDDESALRSYLEDHSETFSRSTATHSNASTKDISEQKSDCESEHDSEEEDESSYGTNKRLRAVKHTNKGLKKKNQRPRSVLKKPTDWNDTQSVRTSTTRVSFAPGADVVSVMGSTRAGSITSRYHHDKYLTSSSKRLQAIYSRQAMPGQKLELRKGVKSNRSKKSKKIRPSTSKGTSSKKSDASVRSLPRAREKKSRCDNESVESSRTSSKPPTAPKTPRNLSEAKQTTRKKSPKAADDDVSEAPSRASRSRKTTLSSNSSVTSTIPKVQPRKVRPVKLKKRLGEESDAESVKSRITL